MRAGGFVRRASGHGAGPFAFGLLVVSSLLLAGCGDADGGEGSSVGDAAGAGAAPLPALQELAGIPAPAENPAAEQNLFAADDGTVYLSWFERLDEGHALRFSTLDPADPGADWSEPRTITAGDHFFVNWADFPSMHQLPDGTLAAHWLQRSGPGPVDYDVHLAWSEDGGRSWSDPVVPHRDGTDGEHGFVSLVPWPGEDDSGSAGVGAVWLDARNLAWADSDRADGPAAMSLRFTSATPDGLGDEVLLDERVCDCCQTSAVRTGDGVVVAYRDRTADEIRDISVVRFVNGAWTEPQSVHDDGWEIAACPVNGPMVDADGDRVAVAWFTAAASEPIVRVAFSDDGGETFAAPIRVDAGEPVGRVAVAMLDGGEAFVTWLEREGDEHAAVLARTVTPAGERTEPVEVARSTAGRSSGFPRMARVGSDLVFAWTDVTNPDTGPQLRTARAVLATGGPRDAASGTHEPGFEPIDEPAPEFAATDLQGNEVSLADYRGDAVLLNVWATWCAPCRVEMPELQALSDQLGPEGLQVVGVSIDGPGSEAMIERFLDQLGIDFTILRDPEDRISGLVGATAVPMTLLIDREGRIQWRHMGQVTADDPALRGALDQVL